MATRKNWGAIRKLPSNRFQASYVGPDGVRHNASDTFRTKTDAANWLTGIRAEIQDGTWVATPLVSAEPTAGGGGRRTRLN